MCAYAMGRIESTPKRIIFIVVWSLIVVFVMITADDIKPYLSNRTPRMMQNSADLYSHSSSWMGNTWITKGGRLYTPEQVHFAFANTTGCILFVGDSLGRRLSGALGTVLQTNITNTRDVDLATLKSNISPQYHGPHKWPFDHDKYCVHFHWSPKIEVLEKMVYELYEHDRFHYTAVVIAVGTHDVSSHAKRIDNSISMTQLYAANITSIIDGFTKRLSPVIWRTAPHSRRSDGFNHELSMFNTIASNICLSHPSHSCVVMDAETLMKNRSVGEHRIAGDSEYHFGEDGVMAMLQYLLFILFGTPSE